jgi:hypothetical protein
VDWLKGQSWFKEKITLYNIVVNQQLLQGSQNTPQHNKLQNKFLDTKYQKLLVDSIFIKKKKSCDLSISTISDTIIFQELYNWNFVLYHRSEYVDMSDKETTHDSNYDYYKPLIYSFGSITETCNIYCEIKPLLSDDYSHVLLKMKSQILLTDKTNHKNHKSYAKIYILFIEKFTSEITSIEELRMIFSQSDIQILFIDELHGDMHEFELEDEIKKLKRRLFQLETERDEYQKKRVHK